MKSTWLPIATLLLTGCAGQAQFSVPAGSTTVVPGAGESVSRSVPVTRTGYVEPVPLTLPVEPTEQPLQEIAPPDPLGGNSVVNVVAGDLFDRIRSGFQLEDVDQKAIDRELNWFANNPDYLERVFGRAELYMHYIVDEIERRGMPHELALLPVVESAFEPYAYSKARASGLWQFIPGTGSKYGLKQNWWYDGRRDVVESTRAALDYLQALHDEFGGDWLLAIAGYNCGEGNVRKAIRRNQRAGKPTDFWHLQLPRETRAYVPKLLAMSRLVGNPAENGLEFSRIPDQAYFTPVATGGQIDLQVVAEITGITKDEIYELNPAFHRWATDPAGPYSLLLPLEVADGVEATLLGLTPDQRMRVERYTVQPSDTVAAVAARYSTTTSVLRELNGMDNSDKLAIGTELRVPASNIQMPEKAARAALLVDRRGVPTRRGTRPVIHVVRRGDTLSGIARRMGTDMKTLASLNNMGVNDTIRAGQKLVLSPQAAAQNKQTTTASSGDGRRVTYTVRRGDTLYGIARLLQVSLGELLGWNGMSKGSIIKPGQKLVAFVSSRG